MESTTINISVVEQNRSNMQEFGNLFGKCIFRAAKTPVIIDFNQKLEMAKNSKDLFLNRNIDRYKVQAINISSLNLGKGIDGEHEIIINEGKVDENGESIEIRCPLSNSKFTKEVTVDNISESLTKDSSTHVYFSNANKLTDYLNQSNYKEKARVDKLCEELKKISEMLEKTSDNNEAFTKAYYNQLDGKKTEVRLHVNSSND